MTEPRKQRPAPAAEPTTPASGAVAESTRDKILMVALDVFAEHGYEGTTTRTICGRAGVNIAALNYHWRSKDQLWHAALEECGRRFARLISEVDFAREPREVISDFVRRMFDDFAADPRFVRLLAWSSLQAGAMDYDAAIRFFRPLVELGQGYMKRQHASGHVGRDIDVEAVVALVQGMIIYTFVNKAGLERWFGKGLADPAHAARMRDATVSTTLVMLGLDGGSQPPPAPRAKASQPPPAPRAKARRPVAASPARRPR